MSKCRFCGTELTYTFANLGMSPLSNSYLKKDQLNVKEEFYPLHAYACEKCFLVQLEEFESPQNIFSDYAYFSSYSESWLMHAKEYTEMMIEKFNIDTSKYIVEIASNDGYLLKNFKEKHYNNVLGIEPAQNIAEIANEKGIKTISEFFGTKLASILKNKHKADVLIGNNVLAHVPDINDFVEGMKIILNNKGIITMEFPHLLRLINENQFDTIYHEHFSYLSLISVKKIFESHGLEIFDVEELKTHGGSLRIYAKHKENINLKVSENVQKILNEELKSGLNKMESYREFSEKIKKTKRNILRFFIDVKNNGKSIVGYGAPAKGNTLLNYCGIANDFLDYTVDISPHKQGLYLPGSHIPIYSPDRIRETKPDYVIILPWNLKNEIVKQMEFIRDWNGKFVTLIPSVEVF
ncbi:class I SAM-dependent methyltransferase [Clostridium felsineum]|uniref:class I SAM-dependent methyltransferase n=1 Tax=Clostridium felsineum TaxID=36839 RepID=UPI0009CCA92A|nr:class I SAM-dependent methyltransferase [Clostridium felsineum]URZ00951.1 hypothetical protein CLAUR_009390 [Clostridium felsineum]